MDRLRFYLALWISRLIACVIDIVARGRGTNLPGAVALKIDPQFITHFRGINPEKTIFLTGTNGKSSTTTLLNHILTEAGYRVVSNLGGANMTAGVAVPLLKNCSLTGKLDCDFLVMETDERYLGRISAQLPAKYLGITNIQKDQVQRNGEPSFIREKIRDAIRPDMTVFLNGDEPNTLSLMNAGAKQVIRYSVAPHARSFVKDEDFFAVTMPCPVCHNGIRFRRYNLDNIGPFHCPVCGFGGEETAEYRTTAVSFEEKNFTLNGNSYTILCNQPEFLYSYTLAAAIALVLGVDEGALARALETYEQNLIQDHSHKIGRKPIRFIRMKQENSETLQAAMNGVSADSGTKTLVFGLDEYIDFYPPYINGCYMFDCSFRGVLESGTRRCITTAPALGQCGALRFLYEGIEPASITVLPDSLEPTLAAALEQDSSDSIYLIEEIPFWKR